MSIGQTLLDPDKAFEEGLWTCYNCGYIHSKSSDLPESDPMGNALPFRAWGSDLCSHSSLTAQRLWKAFFTVATQSKETYWKQCNMCGKVLPASAFSHHTGWGPLEKQMECRYCKAVINAKLNPKRTKQQLHESAAKRRVGDLLMEGENEHIDLESLFARFDRKCFKTGKPLDINDRRSWEVDHLLPSRYLYPLRMDNAVLLSREANENKRDRWPSQFYTNKELVRLAKLIGANLGIISNPDPIVNQAIDVNKCVDRLLNVRSRTDLAERIKYLKKIISENELEGRLSQQNRKILAL